MTTATSQPAVKERPIIFSAPMVKAILAGTKTQTRRVVKPQPGMSPPYRACMDTERHWSTWVALDEDDTRSWRCPYGLPGDRLYVKEAVACDPHMTTTPVHYFADGELSLDRRHDAGLLKRYSPRYCPRWASRITLEITAVRVQRLVDITESDAIAEGMLFLGGIADDFDMAPWADPGDPEQEAWVGARGAFTYAWDRINGKGSWKANPWVWAITFRRVTP